MIDATIHMASNTQAVITFFNSCVTLYVIIMALIPLIVALKKEYVGTSYLTLSIIAFSLLFFFIFVILLFIQETFVDVNIVARFFFIVAISILTFLICKLSW